MLAEEHHQLKSQFFYPFSTRSCLIQQKDVKNDALKLRRRSERQAATVWINLFSDVCFGQHENPNNLDCPNPKKVSLKGKQPLQRSSFSRAQRSTMGKKICLSMHARNFGSDKILRSSVSMSTPSCWGEILHFKHPSRFGGNGGSGWG